MTDEELRELYDIKNAEWIPKHSFKNNISIICPNCKKYRVVDLGVDSRKDVVEFCRRCGQHYHITLPSISEYVKRCNSIS